MYTYMYNVMYYVAHAVRVAGKSPEAAPGRRAPEPRGYTIIIIIIIIVIII